MDLDGCASYFEVAEAIRSSIQNANTHGSLALRTMALG